MIEQNKYFKTMKTIKFSNLLWLLLPLLVLTACVEDDDFDTPDVTVVEPTLDGPVIDLDAVAAMYIQEYLDENNIDEDDYDPNDPFDENIFVTFEDTNDYMSGYVVSSDEAGNFFEELILQDKPENPTYGIKLLIDESPLFTRYEPGQKVYVKLNSLTIGVDNGVLALGILNGGELDQIAGPSEFDFIQRSSEIATLVPLAISLDAISDRMTNQYVILEDAQFNRNEVLIEDPKTFAAEETDEFDGERILESCTASSPIILSTSTFADFKGLSLPAGRGSISGVLTKNFFGDEYNLAINSTTDINFSNDAERCDPAEIDCGLADTQGDINIFADDFETQAPFSPISGNGWTNYIQEGTEAWEAYTSGGSNASLGVSARISAFGSGDASTIAWLISPAIDLDAQDNETLVFKTSNSFDDDSDYELLFSSDWDGTEANITSATWGVLPAATLVTDDDNFTQWIDSGIVDLSCAEGTIYIAFKYIGNDIGGNNNGTLEFDEISIDYSN